MRYFLLAWFFIAGSSVLQAAEKKASFVLMPAYWYGYHWEQTPDALDKTSERHGIVTAAWLSSFGLAVGATWLQNTQHTQDSRVQLSGTGLSVGYVGAEHLSAFYTYFHQPRLDYDFPSLDAKASYYGGQGSIVDLGLHFGLDWLRFGPRVLMIDVRYKESSVTSGAETESAKLEGNPWRDRWLEPYLGLWLLF